MLTPTPLLRPSPLDIPGLFAGTFEALKRRFGLFVLIALFPSVFALVILGGGAALGISIVAAVSAGGSRALPIGVVVGIGLVLVGALAMLLAQLKSYAMLSVAAYEIAQGGRPDFRGLLARTKGFLPRMAPVIWTVIGCVVAVYALVGALMVGVIATLGSRARGSETAVGLFVVMVLLFLLVIPLVIFLQTKLLYTIPATALEGMGGIDGMKRSWKLTKGAFWRTFGYYLLASVAVAAISYAISFIGQLALLPGMASMTNSSDPSRIFASLAALLPAYLLVFGLQLVAQLVAVPFLQTYVTYMFIDQVRRSELPAAPYGYGGTPTYGYNPGAQGQYYAPPGQYYGQAGPGYPTSGPGNPQQDGWQVPPGPGPQQPPQSS